MKILSLFDGMACGAVAFTKMGLQIDRYVAYEYDEETANEKKGRPYGYAALVASHNFPFIEQRGNVFQADFTEYQSFDWLIGGSPCTYWSIAQKNNRETEASGLGWELFSQYVRAVKEARPKYFLYENNKSMSKEIKASITESFGFEPVLINSALVSAQNRQRLYWVGIRQPDGTYRKADIEQPEDRGILLRDVLDNAVAWREKSYCIDANYYKGGNLTSFTKQSGTRFMAAEPVNTTADGKAQTLRATCYKDGIRNMVGNNVDRKTCVAEPVCVAQRGRYAESGEIIQHYEPREDGKTNAITTVQEDNAIAEPVRVGDLPNGEGQINGSQAMRIYDIDGKSVNLVAGGGGMGGKTGLYAVPVESEELVPYVQRKIGEIVDKYGYLPERFNPYNCSEITDKSPTLTAAMCRQTSSASVFSVIASDGKTYPVYEVLNGLITIKDKQYPIKLADGFYIIRKLTVSECMRLQTVPGWYDFSVISNLQAYKCLGNGWTVDVITHLIQSAQIENAPTESQLR